MSMYRINICWLLIFQNIKVEDDPFVPTQGDLAGFWDMVHIQVVHIHTLFAELRKFQKNDWKRTGEVSFLFPEPKKEPEKPKKYKRVKKANSKTGNESKSGSEPKSEAAKARDEARKKMLEDRKKQMKLKQQQKQCENSNQENEVIFVEFWFDSVLQIIVPNSLTRWRCN